MSRRQGPAGTRFARRLGGYGAALALALVTGLLVTSGAPAQLPPTQQELDKLQGMALADAERCNACHSMDKTLIGPPFRAIAARHENQNRQLMVDVLAQKILLGGAGDWGVVPMVPNEHVSMANARKLAAWILGLGDRKH